MKRPVFSTVQDYAACFTNPDYWRPYVEAICTRHALSYSVIRAGLPGSNAVFLVDERYAVKLYPDLFGGARSYPVERACYGLVAGAVGIPAPALVAAGDLFDQDGWPWPYLVTTVMPGLSLGESRVAYSDRERLAAWLGPTLRHIHTLPIATVPELAQDWTAYHDFLTQQRATATMRHAEWGLLPAHLQAQLDRFLPAAAALYDPTRSPCLFHGDLNRDHVLGLEREGHWEPAGLIDFGDARVGDPAYDLVALHLGLFDADKHLLRIFLDAYGDPRLTAALPSRAMALALLHEFNVLEGLPLDQAATLDELAAQIWDLNAPDLTPHQGQVE